MKAIKDNGISVISMQDLLAWRKGAKAIPSKRAVITIDDEWNSQYYVAWPIMKEFGYPFTLFIYTQWVNTGGKAMTWAQLGEMRDAGVDIEAHTVSHRDLRHAPKGQDYTTWLHNEVYGSKIRKAQKVKFIFTKLKMANRNLVFLSNEYAHTAISDLGFYILWCNLFNQS